MKLSRIRKYITERESQRLLDTRKTIIDPMCPRDAWYRLDREHMLEILLARATEGYAARETEKSIILFRP